MNCMSAPLPPKALMPQRRTKLAHLCELGVTHLELMPLATFPGERGWGYDGVDLFAPFPAYGTPARTGGFCARLPRMRSRRAVGRGLQPFGARWELSGGIRTVFHRPLQNRVGRRDQLRRSAQR